MGRNGHGRLVGKGDDGCDVFGSGAQKKVNSLHPIRPGQDARSVPAVRTPSEEGTAGYSRKP